MNINNKKKELRKILKIKRNKIYNNESKKKLDLESKLSDLVNFKTSNIVATFLSINTEIPMNKLNEYLLNSNKTICLPVVKKNYDHLLFKKFDKKTNLQPGKYGILEPENDNLEIIPDLILTPCLAFDLNGYRIGYGGGYYDKTFYKFKQSKQSFVSVAVAFEDQKVDKLISDEKDQKINFILTEKQIYKIK
tara:strand:- start:1 stop:576 length:576 start_codon:yes stop_codon:yes gene_type:complete